MAVAQRTAETDWEGSAARGSGTVTFTSSGATDPLPVSLSKRTEQSDTSQTNPEEMIAAAHSCCYAMALSNVLSQQKTPPDSLHVTAEVTLDEAGEGFAITTSVLTVEGEVPDLDDDGFQQATKDAEAACPVSNALRNNVEITIDATLKGS